MESPGIMVELGEISLLRESQGGKKGEIPALWGGLIWGGGCPGSYAVAQDGEGLDQE